MPLPFQFENFSDSSVAPRLADQNARMDKKIGASYEQGYKAGWDDATAEISSENTRISADLAQSLTSVSCNAADIHAEILALFHPFLKDITDKILPEIAQSSLSPTIIETLRPMIEQGTAADIQVVVNRDNIAEVQTLVEAATTVPIKVQSEDTLGPGQVFLRVGAAERSIDLDDVVCQIKRSIEAFFSEQSKNLRVENAG